MPYRNSMPPLRVRPARPFRQIPLDLRVQVQRNSEVPLRQLRDQGCSRYHLCQRGNVVHCCRPCRRRLGVITQFPKRTHRQFSAITNSQRRARKPLVRNRFLDHIVGWLQLCFALRLHRLHGHWVCGQLDSKSRLHVHTRHGHRQMPAHWNLPKQRTRRRNLCDIANPKGRQPRLSLRKSLD